LVSPKHHSWMLRGKERVEDNILDLADPFGKLVYFLLPFKEDAVFVGEVENPWEGGRLAIPFDLLDD